MSYQINPYPASQLKILSIQFSQQWDVVLPRIFRFIEQVYVDKFFEDGTLRLSSFEQFRKHSDEQRRDSAEGFGLRQGIGQNATIMTVSGRGGDCYVLCGSLLCTEKLQGTFPEADGCFAIDDTICFAQSIAHALPGFTRGFEGPAIYQDDPTIRRDLGADTVDEMFKRHSNPDGTLDMNKLFEMQASIGGYEEFFMKHSRFAYQAEYRLLWSVSQKVDDFIDLKVPEARQYCRKLR